MISLIPALVASIVVIEAFASPINLTAWGVWFLIMAALLRWFVRFSRKHTGGNWHWHWGERSSDK